MTPDREDRLPLQTALRKANRRIVPLLAICYCVAYIDRVNVSFAALQMNRDLGFSPAVYGFGSGIFFLSYALCELPSSRLLLRFGPRRWLSRIMVSWGALAMLMVFVRSSAGFYTARLLLGAAEAGFFPGVLYYLTLWFPQGARRRVVSRFYVALPLSGTFMGSVAGTLLNLDGRLGLRGWQWLFLLEGLPAILLGVALLRWLPESPADAAWLSAAERTALLPSCEPPSADVAEGLAALRTALLDVRVWQVAALGLCGLTVLYAYSFTAPLLLAQAMHLSAGRIGGLVAALGLVGAASMLVVAWLADRRPSPVYLFGCVAVMAAGCIGVGVQHSSTALVASLTLLVIGFYGSQGPYWALPMMFLRGPSAAGGLAFITMVGVVGGFAGPYLMGLSRQLTGQYRLSMLFLGALTTLSVLLVASLHRAERRSLAVTL